MSPEDINSLPPLDLSPELRLILTPAEARDAVAALMNETVLGFDTETRPSFQKGEFYHVALVQLATEKTVYLFRLCKAPMMEELAKLFSNPNILKVGVATRDDVKGLLRLHDFDPAGFLDLALKVSNAGRTVGLRALVAEHLGMRMVKAAKTTNWENSYLSGEQLNYAAKDALAGLLIYQKLLNEKRL